MNIEFFYGVDLLSPKATVWCKSSEITQQIDGSYTFNNPVPSGVGTGSEIIVIDSPGMMLFYDADEGKAYDWTKEG